MSRANVGMVIDKLLTDENLRLRFALDPMETVAELCLRGFDLSPQRDRSVLPDGCWCLVPEKRRERRTATLRVAQCRERKAQRRLSLDDREGVVQARGGLERA